jgi:hypothetical protein
VVEVSERVRRRVGVDFPDQVDQVVGALARLTDEVLPREDCFSAAVERIQVAVLIVAQRHLGKLDEAVALGRMDWRDLLVAACLADDGWEQLVETELASAPAPHIWVTRRRPRT